MAEHTLRSHKRFAASAAPRWFVCHGSIRLTDGLPEQESSEYAKEGTRAHEWLEYRLVGGAKPDHEETEEMIAGTALFKRTVAEIPGPCSWIVEKKTEVLCAAAPGEVGGTTDFAAYNEELRKLWVIDYKFGAGVAVEVEDNEQLLTYVLSVIDTYGFRPETIELTIVQPRAYHPDGPVRTAPILTLADVLDFRMDLEDAVAACLQPDAPLVPGAEQCRWCEAKTFCPAREAQALTVAGTTFKSFQMIAQEKLPDAKGLTPDRIGQILAARPLVEDWFAAVAEEAYRQALAGVHIPGQKLVNPIGRRKWEQGEDDTAIELSLLTGLPADSFIKKKLIGVTEADDLFAVGLRSQPKEEHDALKKRYADLTLKKAGDKLQLVADSDRRPAVNPAAAAFKGVVQIPHIQSVQSPQATE